MVKLRTKMLGTFFFLPNIKKVIGEENNCHGLPDGIFNHPVVVLYEIEAGQTLVLVVSDIPILCPTFV